MRDSWYYAVPEGQIGPITLQELKETLPNLPNAKDVYIWHDSLPDWIRAGDLAEIVANAKTGVPQGGWGGPQDHSERDFRDDEQQDANWDPRSLEGFHPDPAYAIAAPDTPRAASDPGAPKARRRSPIVRILMGVVIILLGCGLFYLGITGKVALAAGRSGLSRVLINASPGLVLLVVGVVVIASGRRKIVAK